MSSHPSRRRFIEHAALGVSGIAGLLRTLDAHGQTNLDPGRPIAAWGLQIGDVIADRAMVWSRADRPSRLFVEWSVDPAFREPVTCAGRVQPP